MPLPGKAGSIFTQTSVSATMIDDAVDQWCKRLCCSMETSGRHFEHLLQHCNWNLSNLDWRISWYSDTSPVCVVSLHDNCVINFTILLYIIFTHMFYCVMKQESCAIAKTTARCALYIGYSTIILFTTLCGFDSERI